MDELRPNFTKSELEKEENKKVLYEERLELYNNTDFDRQQELKNKKDQFDVSQELENFMINIVKKNNTSPMGSIALHVTSKEGIVHTFC